MDLEDCLKANKVWYRLFRKPRTVHTADAASATGIPLNRVTKSLVLLGDESPFVAIIPGDRKLNLGKVRELLGVKKLKLAPLDQAEHYSGYPPGGTPPVFYRGVKKVLIDVGVMRHETVFGGGGTRKTLVELRSKDVQRLNDALVAEIASKP